MDNLIIFIAKAFILIPVLVTAVLLWRVESPARKEYFLLIVVGGLTTFLLAKLASHLYSDPRPLFKDHAQTLIHSSDYNGFPSDHTLLAALLAFLAFLYSRKAGLILLLVAVLIGWARVAAHVHHLNDIVGSFVICGLVVGLLSLIIGSHHSRRHHSPKA